MGRAEAAHREASPDRPTASKQIDQSLRVATVAQRESPAAERTGRALPGTSDLEGQTIVGVNRDQVTAGETHGRGILERTAFDGRIR